MGGGSSACIPGGHLLVAGLYRGGGFAGGGIPAAPAPADVHADLCSSWRRRGGRIVLCGSRQQAVESSQQEGKKEEDEEHPVRRAVIAGCFLHFHASVPSPWPLRGVQAVGKIEKWSPCTLFAGKDREVVPFYSLCRGISEEVGARENSCVQYIGVQYRATDTDSYGCMHAR